MSHRVLAVALLAALAAPAGASSICYHLYRPPTQETRCVPSGECTTVTVPGYDYTFCF